jgi:hypothetical protein
MKYKSAVFCEHANECPTGICTCPNDCACRESMCKWEGGQAYVADRAGEPSPELTEAERNLRLENVCDDDCAVITAELDRLRAIGRALRIERKATELALAAGREELDRLHALVTAQAAEIERLKSNIASMQKSCEREQAHYQQERDNLLDCNDGLIRDLNVSSAEVAQLKAKLKAQLVAKPTIPREPSKPDVVWFAKAWKERPVTQFDDEMAHYWFYQFSCHYSLAPALPTEAELADVIHRAWFDSDECATFQARAALDLLKDKQAQAERAAEPTPVQRPFVPSGG